MRLSCSGHLKTVNNDSPGILVATVSGWETGVFRQDEQDKSWTCSELSYVVGGLDYEYSTFALLSGEEQTPTSWVTEE